jgi:exopolysaccharide biosynthesis polyprenyl glycosylphosphotransferase
MLARKREINLQLNELADALLLGLAFWASHQLRFHGLISLDSSPEIPEFAYFFWALAVIIPFGPFLLELQGFYYYPLEKSVWKSLSQIARAGVWLFVLVAVSGFLFKLEFPSRSVAIIFAVVAATLLVTKEHIFTSIYKRRLARGGGAERILIAGEPAKMAELEAALTATQRLEIDILERIDLEANDTSALVAALHTHSVGRVVLAFNHLELQAVQRAIAACEVEGVEAWLCADFIRTSIARPTYEVLGNRPMLVFRTTPDISYALLVKSFIDRTLAGLGLLFLLPFLLLIAVIIKLTSPGPAIFRQLRAGRHGRPFTMYKFRSMRTDAEMRRAEFEAFNLMSGPVFKLEDDPRVTPFGRFLRRTSIDELPQLINVLLGPMSLVGPRPLPVYEVEQFASAAHRRRLSMKPGLTCIWQIRGRNQVTKFEDWVEMDLEYIDNWSLGLDLWILLRTGPVVLFGFGAK